jgi:hypothetical protein
MDEYTFLVMAKLKADRVKLEREAAQEAYGDDEFASRPEISVRDESGSKSYWFTKQDWRTQS